MTEANDIQIGGDHYQKPYQHWDFVIDLKIHYLLGCATKYVSRWRDKNGIQDLQKAIHYLAKAEEHEIMVNMSEGRVYKWYDKLIGRPLFLSFNKMVGLERFCTQHDVEESDIIRKIVLGSDYIGATRDIEKLIMEYTSSNSNYFKG